MSELDTLEMKHFYAHLVFTCKTLNSRANISMTPKILAFDFSGLQIYLGPRKSSICNCAK